MEGVLNLQRQPTAAAAAAAGGEPGSAVEIQRWANQDNETDDTGTLRTKVVEDKEGTSKAPKQRAHTKRKAQREIISPKFKCNYFPVVCLVECNTAVRWRNSG